MPLIAPTLLLVAATMIAQPPPNDHVTVRMIVVGSADEAAQVVQRLTNGADFAVLAKSLSIDPSADSGGWLGRVAVSSLRPELRRALEGLKPGQVSPVRADSHGLCHPHRGPRDRCRPGRITRPRHAEPGRRGQREREVHAERRRSGRSDRGAAGVSRSRRTGTRTRARSARHGPRPSPTPSRRWNGRLLPASEARARWQPLDEVQAHHLLAELYAYRGQMGDVIAHFQKARELAVAAVPAAVPQLDESLGIAYLHRSAFDNGVHHKPGADVCCLRRGCTPSRTCVTPNARSSISRRTSPALPMSSR